MMRSRRLWRSNAVLPALGVVWALALWWLATLPLPGRSSLLAEFGPGPALAALARMAQDGTLLHHSLISLRRVLMGLALAIGIGVPLGLLSGYVRGLERTTSPVFQFLRTISPLSWMPIAIMVLGIADRAVVFLVAVAAVWPVLLNTAAGVRTLDRGWLWIARSVGARPAEMLVHVALPAVLGHLVSGIRLATGVAWIVLVPAEMLGVASGLGYLVLDTRDRLAYPELAASVLAIGSLGFLMDAAVRALEIKLGWAGG